MTSPSMLVLPPGSTIGMLGAGQLGRMTALAAARLGYRIHLFSPEGRDSACGQVAAAVTTADWADELALREFAEQVDVVTLEWENVPTATIDCLSQYVPVHPGSGVFAIAQDRLREKQFAIDLGLQTAPFRTVDDVTSLRLAVSELGLPAILKSRRLGYDGKGQVRLAADSDIEAAWAELSTDAAILEGFVGFASEASVIVARRADGVMRAYPAVTNRHRDGILATTSVPANLPAAIMTRAEQTACALTEGLGVVGLLAVELFILEDGQVLVNEVAPRPHNSGHWTLDFSATSQFEQLVRAICGLPLGATSIASPCIMTNLLGDDVDAWPALLVEPEARVHFYGKGKARPGRKMGHVTRPL